MKALISAFAAFSLATILAEAYIIWSLNSSGALTPEKREKILKVVYELDHLLEKDELSSDPDQPSSKYEEIARARVTSMHDIDGRNAAIVSGGKDMLLFRQELSENVKRFKDVKAEFGRDLDRQVLDERDNGLRQVQATLEVIPPKQAKKQIVRFIESGELANAATILKNMALDKSKKILAEFKDEQDKDILLSILKEMKDGSSNAPNPQ